MTSRTEASACLSSAAAGNSGELRCNTRDHVLVSVKTTVYFLVLTIGILCFVLGKSNKFHTNIQKMTRKKAHIIASTK